MRSVSPGGLPRRPICFYPITNIVPISSPLTTNPVPGAAHVVLQAFKPAQGAMSSSLKLLGNDV
jgi:hypothetical protein